MGLCTLECYQRVVHQFWAAGTAVIDTRGIDMIDVASINIFRLKQMGVCVKKKYVTKNKMMNLVSKAPKILQRFQFEPGLVLGQIKKQNGPFIFRTGQDVAQEDRFPPPEHTSVAKGDLLPAAVPPK